MCAGITAYRALLESNDKHRYWVVFPGGGGGVGNIAVQFAKARGFRPIVVDTGADKEKLSLANGAEVFIDFQKVDDPIAEVKRVADGIGAHGVVVTAPQAYQNVIDYISTRGGARIMCVGMRKSAAEE
ncbi:Alcohol dehydrogenase superfamily zinc-containing [Macrophomina phaseolina MS6]|uniref:Alcohol dehydrogenase superfamily zinc-containing n=1 Tax=Macrophomina phaseolina (strain MS6) TaxID=1126212 RepID=K2RU60_MACPH|nr:Alcohol dehydrogenase superfamily zinc-containing [Macrophomina phaseolina MS6]